MYEWMNFYNKQNRKRAKKKISTFTRNRLKEKPKDENIGISEVYFYSYGTEWDGGREKRSRWRVIRYAYRQSEFEFSNKWQIDVAVSSRRPSPNYCNSLNGSFCRCTADDTRAESNILSSSHSLQTNYTTENNPFIVRCRHHCCLTHTHSKDSYGRINEESVHMWNSERITREKKTPNTRRTKNKRNQRTKRETRKILRKIKARRRRRAKAWCMGTICFCWMQKTKMKSTYIHSHRLRHRHRRRASEHWKAKIEFSELLRENNDASKAKSNWTRKKKNTHSQENKNSPHKQQLQQQWKTVEIRPPAKSTIKWNTHKVVKHTYLYTSQHWVNACRGTHTRTTQTFFIVLLSRFHLGCAETTGAHHTINSNFYSIFFFCAFFC